VARTVDTLQDLGALPSSEQSAAAQSPAVGIRVVRPEVASQLDATERRGVREAHGEYQNLRGQFSALRELVGRRSVGGLAPAALSQNEAQIGQLMGSLRLAYQSQIRGTPSESDQALIDGIMPAINNPATGGGTMRGLETSEGEAHSNRLRAMGLALDAVDFSGAQQVGRR